MSPSVSKKSASPKAPAASKVGKPDRDQAARDRTVARLAVLRKAEPGDILISNPLDVTYFTGLLIEDSFLFVTPKKAILITDFRFQEEAEKIKDLFEIRIRSSDILETVGQVAAAEGTRTLACQSDHFTVHRQGYLGMALKEIKPTFVWYLMAHSRVRKDEHEVGLLRKAIKIQQESLEATLEQVGKRLKKGVKTLERDLAAILEFEMKTRGSSQPSFETIVASGATGSLPHYRPKDRPIKPGMPVLIDWGATYQGYHSDMTRTICFGKWPKEIEKIYEIVREAYSLAAAAIRPGMTGKELDAIARNHIASKGYGPQFGHSLGHGIGLEIHENPRISPVSTTELAPGMVITIEPGIYLPGVGGVRLEDDYLVTDKGGQNLCSLPMDLKWATW